MAAALDLLLLVLQLFMSGTISAQSCENACTPCKVFSSGLYEGEWSLKDTDNLRCADSCLYQRNNDSTEMCFCDPGTIQYELCTESTKSASKTTTISSIRTTINPTTTTTATINPTTTKGGVDSFESCVKIWCLQDNTDEQYTRCESTTDEGETCINPEIKAGSTEGGIPQEHARNYDYYYYDYPFNQYYDYNYGQDDINTWCKMIFHEDRIGSITTGPRDASAPKGNVYWCYNYRVGVHEWCDPKDHWFKGQTLDSHDDRPSITSLSCKR